MTRSRIIRLELTHRSRARNQSVEVKCSTRLLRVHRIEFHRHSYTRCPTRDSAFALGARAHTGKSGARLKELGSTKCSYALLDGDNAATPHSNSPHRLRNCICHGSLPLSCDGIQHTRRPQLPRFRNHITPTARYAITATERRRSVGLEAWPLRRII